MKIRRLTQTAFALKILKIFAFPIFHLLLVYFKISKNSESLFEAGYAYFQINNHVAAKHYFKKSIEKDGSNIYPRIWLAHILMHEKMFDEAEEHYRNIVRLDPKNNNALTNIAYVLIHTDRIYEAIEHLNEVIEILPDDSQNYSLLGECYYRIGDIENSLLNAHISIEKNHNDIMAVRLLKEIKGHP